MLITLRHTAIAVLCAFVLVATATTPVRATESEASAGRTPAGSSESRAEHAIDNALRYRLELHRVAGQPALIGETDEGELTAMVASEPVPVTGREDPDGGEDPDGRVMVVAKGVPRGEQLPTGRHESVSSGNNTTTVVEGQESGFRIFNVLENDSGSKQFSYEAYRGEQQLRFLRTEDGEIHIGTGNSREFSSFGAVGDPWAFDANGSAVKTTYEISADGTTLTQHVLADAEATYPVVADPAFTFWAGQLDCSWGSCTFYLERAKTYWLRDQLNSLGVTVGLAVLTGTFCGWVSAAFAFGGPAAIIAVNVCRAAMASLYWTIKSHLNGSYRCLTIKSYHWSNILYIGHVSGSNSHCFYNV